MQTSELIALFLAAITVLMAAIGYFIKKIMDKTEALEKDVKPIAPAIVEIQSKFTQAGHNLLFPLTVSPGSPLKLTDFGKSLLQKSGFHAAIAQHRAELIKRVKQMEPKTNYDIQEDSIEVIRQLLASDDPIAKSIKDYAFNNGLLLEIFILPAGITLRDEVMKELTF